MEYHNTIIGLNEGRSKVFVGGMEDVSIKRYCHRGVFCQSDRASFIRE